MMRSKRVHWGVKDIAQGLMIRTISRRAHQYILKNKIFPLPALSTLQKWVERFQCEPGIQDQILKILKEQMTTNDSLAYNVAALAFDEMDIKKEYQYDHKLDKVFGPHKKLQLAVLRGIVSNWKQQVYYDFDQPMTKEVLFSIIAAVEENGIQVWTIACDLGNQGLIKSLGVSSEKPFFENPFEASRKVFVFPDAPHLLKLLRNHLLDQGYVLSDGTEINRKDIEHILSEDVNELKIHHKLQPVHFNCTYSTRQRVRLAAQLISHTTATAIRCLHQNKKKLADWIDLFDQWFDLFNSRVGFNTKKMACRYGVHFEEQDSVLEHTFSCVQSMRAKGRQSLLPFQKGMLLSIRALQGLFCEIKKSYGVKYLLTSRINQDSVENTFSQIRGIGSPHPGPVESKNRLRLILLGKNGKILVQNSSVVQEVTSSNDEIEFDNGVLIMKDVASGIESEVH